MMYFSDHGDKAHVDLLTLIFGQFPLGRFVEWQVRSCVLTPGTSDPPTTNDSILMSKFQNSVVSCLFSCPSTC